MKFKVAAVQLATRCKDVEYNLELSANLIDKAVSKGAKLIVLPESVSAGYPFSSRGEVLPFAEPIPGRTSLFFSELCKKHKVFIAFGMIEYCPSSALTYNTAVLLDSNGDFVGKYRKTHLFINDIAFVVDGDMGVPVFDTELGKISLNICEDVVHFETARLAALSQADILLLPTNWIDSGPDDAWRARAAENGIYVICSDWWSTSEDGSSLGGGSCIINPDGSLEAFMEMGDGIVCAEIDTELVSRKRILAQRKPSYYHSLLANSYLWGPEHLHLPAPMKSEMAIITWDISHDIPQYLQIFTKQIATLDEEIQLLVLPHYCGEQDITDLINALQSIIGSQYCVISGYSAERNPKTTYLFNAEKILIQYNEIHSDTLSENNGFTFIDLPIGRVGLLGSKDMFFPESMRCLARNGVDIVCMSGEWSSDKLYILNERYLFNDCILAASCHSGKESFAYFGAPYEREISHGNKVILQATLDTTDNALREKLDIRKGRIDMYKALI